MTGHSDSPSRTGAWRAYGIWSFLVGIVFFSIYPTCNWLTSLRDSTYALYIPAELSIPFYPEFIWAYMSMYVLFALPPFFLDASRLRYLGQELIVATLVCGAAFLLVPAHLGFERTIPDGTPYRMIFENLFAVDQPHNLVPSLHVVFTSLILFALLDVTRSPLSRAASWSWLALICASTLLVHQHHLIDVLAGLAVAAGVRRWIPWRNAMSRPPAESRSA